MNPHPLRALLDDAARGVFPAPDGGVDVLPPLEHPALAAVVVAFTGHFVIAAEVGAAEVEASVGRGDLSVPLSAAFLGWLGAAVHANPATHDALLCAQGRGSGVPDGLVEDETFTHPRVGRASRYRHDVRVFTTPGRDAVLVVGRGVCDRWELAYEVVPAARGRGLGRLLVAAARAIVPASEPVWAQIAPGNAASLRAALAAGMVPVGAEVLFARTRQ